VKYTREEEIKKCFELNPNLINKKITDIALFFYLQGELANSHLRELSSHKAAAYRQRLGLLSEEDMKEMDALLQDVMLVKDLG